MPDILSVRMQDILYRRKSELRTYKIIRYQLAERNLFQERGRSVQQKSDVPGFRQVPDLGTFFVALKEVSAFCSNSASQGSHCCRTGNVAEATCRRRGILQSRILFYLHVKRKMLGGESEGSGSLLCVNR